MGLVQAEGVGGRDAWEGPLTVGGQVEGGSPGGAVVQTALYDKLAGTGALQRSGGQGQEVQMKRHEL